MCLDLSGSTTQGAVKEILFFSDLPEGHTDVGLKIIPSKAELFTACHGKAASFPVRCKTSESVSGLTDLAW